LVTVTGPGGIGKTRLAIEAARAARVGRAAGAALVELAGVREPAAVAGAVLRVLGRGGDGGLA
jgi:predicted ATPase